MRPVNLIPPDERRGEHAPLRTGALAYLVVGALVAVLVAVTALVLVGNQLAEREADLARLEREDAAAAQRARELAPYVQFKTMSEQRLQTVASLADSRFDWERVMRELSLVLPGDVWLVEMSGSAAPGAGDGGGSLRASAPGPALELVGCAKGQEGVARFVAALKDIDGVTRVGMESSELPDAGSGAGAAADSNGSRNDCRTRGFIAKFQLVVAFDAAPPPATAGAAPAAAEAEAEGGEPTAAEPEAGAEGESR